MLKTKVETEDQAIQTDREAESEEEQKPKDQ
jgi:hypothetical protein